MDEVVDEADNELVTFGARGSGWITKDTGWTDCLHTMRAKFVDVGVDARGRELESNQARIDRQHERRFDPAGMQVLRPAVGASRPFRPPGQNVATFCSKGARGRLDRCRVAAMPVDKHNASSPIGTTTEFENDLRHHLGAD